MLLYSFAFYIIKRLKSAEIESKTSVRTLIRIPGGRRHLTGEVVSNRVRRKEVDVIVSTGAASPCQCTLSDVVSQDINPIGNELEDDSNRKANFQVGCGSQESLQKSGYLSLASHELVSPAVAPCYVPSRDSVAGQRRRLWLV
jgi:hypothetical protein